VRRKLIIIFATLLVLTVLSAAEQILVRRMTDEALRQTQEILAYIREARFDDALQLSRDMDLDWDRNAKVLETMVDHGSTDDVRYAFSRLIAALEEQDSATAMVYAGELEGAIEHVFERQAVTLENIL